MGVLVNRLHFQHTFDLLVSTFFHGFNEVLKFGFIFTQFGVEAILTSILHILVLNIFLFRLSVVVLQFDHVEFSCVHTSSQVFDPFFEVIEFK